MKHVSIVPLLLMVMSIPGLSSSVEANVKSVHKDGIVADADDNEYKTIIIDEQEWMPENPRASRYLEGTTQNKMRQTDKKAEQYFESGFLKWKNGDYRGAIADFSNAIEINPQSAEAYMLRGISKIFLNRIDSRCLDFSRAGELGYGEAYEAIRNHCN